MEILDFTELGLVVLDVSQMEMLQVRGGRYSTSLVWDVSQMEMLQVRWGTYLASLSWGQWSGMSVRWRCYR